MADIDYGAVEGFFQSNWGPATVLAASVLALTLFSGSLLQQDKKDSIALWLMGAQSEESWSRSFVALFDKVFGSRHFSIKCLFRSALFSLIAVVGIWLAMGRTDAFVLRLQAELTLGGTLLIALCVNVAADYISLLQTRYIVGQAHQFHNTLFHLFIIAVDIALSAIIIWLSLLLFFYSPLYNGRADSFSEVAGVFSVFSVFFYSTFATSFWIWVYFLSTCILRFFNRINRADIFDIENQPIRMLGLILAIITFLGSMSVALLLSREDGRTSLSDRLICLLFEDQVCLDVARLTEDQQAKLELTKYACRVDVPGECLNLAWYTYFVDPKSAELVARLACDNQDFDACTLLAGLYATHESERIAETAYDLYRRACSRGTAAACASLGYYTEFGIFTERSEPRASRLYQKSCRLGSAEGCTNFGTMRLLGIGTQVNLSSAIEHYQSGCDGGDVFGCAGVNFTQELLASYPTSVEVVVGEHFKSCSLGNAEKCIFTSLRSLQGLSEQFDPARAARALDRACKLGSPFGCTLFGRLKQLGHGVERDPTGAAELYKFACEAADPFGCSSLAYLTQWGIGASPSRSSALDLYSKGCAGGDKFGCRSAAFLEARAIWRDPFAWMLDMVHMSFCSDRSLGCIGKYLHVPTLRLSNRPAEQQLPLRRPPFNLSRTNLMARRVRPGLDGEGLVWVWE